MAKKKLFKKTSAQDKTKELKFSTNLFKIESKLVNYAGRFKKRLNVLTHRILPLS
jgi:hypothetical protein